MSIRLSKWGIVSVIIALVLFFLPYLTVIWLNKSPDTEIEPVYLTGFMTASGILFGFIGASILTKTESIEYDMMFLVTMDFLFFISAVIQVFLGSLEGKPTLSTLSLVTGSILSNAGTVLILMKRLRLKEM